MLDSGVFPDSLKISKLTPVFKDGDKQNVSNYRPIAVLPCPYCPKFLRPL
jgi:hypothetical protein